MPTFSHDVPTDPRGPAFPIVRTPPGRPLTAIITSPDLVGCYTHYFKGRTSPCDSPKCHLCAIGDQTFTQPNGTVYHQVQGKNVECDGEACEACMAGVPYRWHAYQSALITHNHLHCLFECTAQAAEKFTEYREAHGTLRGCLFESWRYNSKPNGRILIRTKPADLTGTALPKPPDLIKCLSILWGFPLPELTASKMNPEKKTKELGHNAHEYDIKQESAPKSPKKAKPKTKETLSAVEPQTPVE